MTYEEIYDALFMGIDEKAKTRARNELATMSNEEWHDWIDYRQDRERIAGKELS